MRIDFVSGAPVTGILESQWVHGSADRRRPSDPPVQVAAYDQHSYVLRQSKDVTFEAPFLYLLFGNDRAVLFDTGATGDGSVREAVDKVIASWLLANPRKDYQLVVAHSHAHGDHMAGDAGFADRENTTVLGTDLRSVTHFFGFTDWPSQVADFDLGGRILAITGIPGHHQTSIACYDDWTGWLLTGDTVYPGRLYVRDIPASLASFSRLRSFAGERAVTHVLGCHIEMTRQPGRDYPPGCRYQPDEPPLPLTPEQLQHICDGAARLAGAPGVHPLGEAILYNGMGAATNLRLLARGLGSSARGRLVGRRSP